MFIAPSTRQQRLATLFRATRGDVFRAADVMRVLEIGRARASDLLAGWHKQGVIRRVTHGLYAPIRPSMLGYAQVLSEPEVLVNELYQPGYLGGWSAMEYWDLTEQVYRTICVFTRRRVTYGKKVYQEIPFFIRYLPDKQLFGTEYMWCGNTKVPISNVYKTLIDCINDTDMGAGSHQTFLALQEFMYVYGKSNDYDALLDCAIKFNNGAVFKKLGYMAERLQFKSSFIDECRKRMTSGYAFLEKDGYDNELVTRWNLWVPRGALDD